jgi:ribonucleotide monophosphatase NagD (HAD superfamily)
VLVLTGVTGAHDAPAVEPVPDVVADSLAALVAAEGYQRAS